MTENFDKVIGGFEDQSEETLAFVWWQKIGERANTEEEEEEDEEGRSGKLIFIPLVVVIPAFLVILGSTTFLLQKNGFGTERLLIFVFILFSAVTIWDVIVVQSKPRALLFLILGFLQNVIFIVMLSVFVVSMNALIFKIRGIQINDDLQLLLDLYPEQLSHVSPFLADFIVSISSSIATTLFYNFVFRPQRRSVTG